MEGRGDGGAGFYWIGLMSAGEKINWHWLAWQAIIGNKEKR